MLLRRFIKSLATHIWPSWTYDNNNLCCYNRFIKSLATHIWPSWTSRGRWTSTPRVPTIRSRRQSTSDMWMTRMSRQLVGAASLCSALCEQQDCGDMWKPTLSLVGATYVIILVLNVHKGYSCIIEFIILYYKTVFHCVFVRLWIDISVSLACVKQRFCS